jgi:hypothetical protein
MHALLREPIFLQDLLVQTTFSPWWEQVLLSCAASRSSVIRPSLALEVPSISIAFAMLIGYYRDSTGRKEMMFVFSVLHLCSVGELMPLSRIVNIR